MRQVRERTIALLLFIVMLAPVFFVNKAGSVDLAYPIFLLYPSRVTTIGNTFKITLQIWNLEGPGDSGENLFGWGCTVTWTAANLEFMNASEGPMLKQGGYSTFWVAPVVDQAAGTVQLGDARTGSVPGAVGNGVLAYLYFRADVSAVTDLGLDLVKLRNNLGQTLEPSGGPPDYYYLNNQGAKYGPRAASDIYVASNYEAVIDIFDLSTVGINFGRFPITTKPPTAYTGTGWTPATAVYASDDVYATCATKNLFTDWKTFGFAIGGWTGVTKVEVGIESKIAAGGDDRMTIQISNDGGTTWSAGTVVTVAWTTDTLNYYDFTSAFAWTPAMVGLVAVRVTYTITGGSAAMEYIDWLVVRATPTPTAYTSGADVSGPTTGVPDGVIDVFDLAYVATQYGYYF